MPKLDLDAIEQTNRTGYPRPYADAMGKRWYRRLAEPAGLAFVLSLLSEGLLGIGEVSNATEAAERSLDLGRESGNRPAIGMALSRLGDLAMHTGDRGPAATAYLEALENVIGVSETTRAMERLALSRASVPGEARRLIAEAARIRRQHGFPAPPAQQVWIDRAEGAIRVAAARPDPS